MIIGESLPDFRQYLAGHSPIGESAPYFRQYTLRTVAIGESLIGEVRKPHLHYIALLDEWNVVFSKRSTELHELFDYPMYMSKF